MAGTLTPESVERSKRTDITTMSGKTVVVKVGSYSFTKSWESPDSVAVSESPGGRIRLPSGKGAEAFIQAYRQILEAPLEYTEETIQGEHVE